jgi:RimJ/RimL family protein N-acetyltransferase
MITSVHFITVKENSVAENMTYQLQTQRLRLKGLTVSDAEALFRYRSLPEVTQFQSWAPTSIEEAIQFIEEDTCHVMDQPDSWFQLGIFLNENQTMIGDLGIHFLAEGSTVEIGVTVAPAYQGRGFAAEAVLRVVEFLFDTLHKNKVVASVDPGNIKSMKLMKRVGFRLEGIYKNTVLFRGEWTDDAVYTLSREEWQNLTQNRPKPSLYSIAIK